MKYNCPKQRAFPPLSSSSHRAIPVPFSSVFLATFTEFSPCGFILCFVH
jgi:hypothetical protein